MAKIEKIKKGTATIYPATIPQAVVDPTSGKSARAELDEKANHGYDSSPKTLKQVDDNLARIEGDVNLFKEESNLKDAIQDSKIKDIENIISTMNPNQSAQLSVSGVSPLSLPKNAANGGMSVKMEGLTAENEAVNGNFENGLLGRFNKYDFGGSESTLAINSSTPISGNYDIRLTITTPGSLTYLNGLRGAANIGDKIYLHFYAKILSGTPTIHSIHNGKGNSTIYAGNVINGRNTRIIDVVGTSSDLGVIYFDSSSAWDMQMDNFMRINLTKTFGAGNEPTVEECDLIFSDYFEGVKSFEPTGRVRSVDASGENPTHLYLTAPKLRSNGTVKDEIRKGANGYELVKRISEVDGTVLAQPEIIPISYGGILNSAENGTVYHEPIIADAGVYSDKMDILLTDYPIATIVEIIKHENGIDTYLDVSTAVIASDGLSFTHPDLADGDLVLFTYAFDKESTNGNITAMFYDSNVVKIDTVTGKAYKIEDVVTDGVLTRILTEV